MESLLNKINQLNLKVAVLMLSFAAIAGCAQTNTSQRSQISETQLEWPDINNVNAVFSGNPQEQYRTVVFWPSDLRVSQRHLQGGRLAVYFNDRYIAPLKPGEYLQLRGCSHQNTLELRWRNDSSVNQVVYTYPLQLTQSVTQFLAVNFQDNRFGLRETSTANFAQLSNAALETNLLSRKNVLGCEKNVIETLRLNILFDTDQYIIKPEYLSEVTKAASLLERHPNGIAVIEGHTDSQGDASYNQRLSENRAKAVRAALISRYGINANRLTTVGYGEMRPEADNNTRQGRSLNRRVEVVVKER